MTDIGPSIIRTVTMLIVSVLLSFPIISGIGVDSQTWTKIVTALVAAVYYVVVRLLETRVSPKFSWLLLSQKQPARYVKSDVVETANRLR